MPEFGFRNADSCLELWQSAVGIDIISMAFRIQGDGRVGAYILEFRDITLEKFIYHI